MPAVAFAVQVVDGVLAVDLPAGDFTFTGFLCGPDRDEIRETFTVTLPEL